MNPVASQLQHLCAPELVPEGVVVGGGIPCVEPGLNQLPALVPTDAFGQSLWVKIRIAVAERSPRSVKQILAIHEDDGA
jgi:hypothetical protein